MGLITHFESKLINNINMGLITHLLLQKFKYAIYLVGLITHLQITMNFTLWGLLPTYQQVNFQIILWGLLPTYK